MDVPRARKICIYMTRNALDTVPLDFNCTHTRIQKATARKIHSNAPE